MSALHISIPLHDFSHGGTERIALRLAGEWLRMGHRVSVVAGAPDGPMRVQVPEGAQVVMLDPPIARSTFSRWKLGRALAEPIAALAPDVIFLIGNYHFPLARGLKHGLPGVPIVGKVSNPLVPPALGQGNAARAAAAFWTKGVDAIVGMAQVYADELSALLPSRKIATVPDPFLDDDMSISTRSGAPTQPLKLLQVGRKEVQKHPELALQLAAELRERGVDFHLTMLGGGALSEEIARLRNTLKLAEHVTLSDNVPDPSDHYRAADMLVMTSRYEGVPAAIGEALSHGLPVVATPCSPWIEGIGRTAPDCLTASRDHSAAALADALMQRAAQPFSDKSSIENIIGEHRLSNGARRYADLFHSLRHG